ncbi:TB2/DP1, HVA22 family [Dictyocaulus viviparus]|uniref:Receptor expression-enhancing protein n=1 Tax=Dictyocaulus viviparus TaxID=29172 RepID=A0A0D8Y477_DICVI|nr:TB2/DP1, HVA22 family [Dictyocaulus viviparus]
MFALLCQLASAFVGAVIPVFYSYKTIKKPSQKSLSYWSKYWTVFGSFLAVDAVLSTLFINYFIPFYEFGKLIFLIWAVCPQTAGAQFVFDKMLAPFIHRHERKMDLYVERMLDSVFTNGPTLALMVN